MTLSSAPARGRDEGHLVRPAPTPIPYPYSCAARNVRRATRRNDPSAYRLRPRTSRAHPHTHDTLPPPPSLSLTLLRLSPLMCCNAEHCKTFIPDAQNTPVTNLVVSTPTNKSELSLFGEKIPELSRKRPFVPINGLPHQRSTQ